MGNNTHWTTHISKTSKPNPFIIFYVFPTIELFLDLDEEDEDSCFDISFRWLFWTFTISKYWGNTYKKLK